jgi:hypothetical protein
MKRLSDINESVWADMHRRSNTGTIRKEDKWFEERVKAFAERHKFKPDEYSINGSDLTVDVFRNISILKEDLVDGKLPFKFGKIRGNMWLTDNLQLTSLENSPKEVYGNFISYQNRLIDFNGGPELVEGDFTANFNNQLRTLDGSPKKVGGNYNIVFCSNVKNIDGISPEIGGNLVVTDGEKHRVWCDYSDTEYRKLSNIKGQIIRR